MARYDRTALLVEIRRRVNAPTYERMRAEYMGWKFSEPEIRLPESSLDTSLHQLRVRFTCVCGREEMFVYTSFEIEGLLYGSDVVRSLTRGGSFSREHLQEDGYTEEQIQAIERKGEEFDRITRERWEGEIRRDRYATYDPYSTRRTT